MTWLDPAMRPRRRAWAQWARDQVAAGVPCAACSLPLDLFVTIRAGVSAFAWRRFAVGFGFNPDLPVAIADHEVPIWDGGHDIEPNLQLLCQPCHATKTADEARRRARAPKKRLA